MKPKVKYTREEALKLQGLYKESGIECKSLNKALRKSYFERFYDYMSNIINGNKSFAPDELKGF